MKLFFETKIQAESFLAMIPLGFLLPVFLDVLLITGRKLLPVIDTVILSGFGLVIYVFTSAMENGGIQGYHLLGGLCGAVLYTHGIRRLPLHMLNRWYKRKNAVS